MAVTSDIGYAVGQYTAGGRYPSDRVDLLMVLTGSMVLAATRSCDWQIGRRHRHSRQHADIKRSERWITTQAR